MPKLPEGSNLTIYSSLSKEKSPFSPQNPERVKMYVCGITVYDYCHIGHARMLIAFDIIYRHLSYLGFNVDYVRNITDVEDKIFARAKANNEDFSSLSQRFIDYMIEDERVLNIIPPKQQPRATEYMAEIVQLITNLESKGIAYQGKNGDVYFAIDQFEEYGKLSGRKPEELIVGSRVDVEHAKNNPLDFVLWKMAKEGEASWDSPWGNGRPGWHIECSAMSMSCLGETLDIHGGGSDLMFPHHENEIAQSEAASGKEFSQYWMHCGPVRVNKEKMSKSLGNFFTIREVLEDFHPEVLRYFLSTSHYRSPINYSLDNLELAKKELDKFYQALLPFSDQLADAHRIDNKISEQTVCLSLTERFDQAMNDDFNTAKALAVMFETLKALAQSEAELQVELAYQLQSFGKRLGFLYLSPIDYFQKINSSQDQIGQQEIENLIEQRRLARENKDWAKSDEIRDRLNDLGVILEDSSGKTTWKIK